jgi:hypothetical protein
MVISRQRGKAMNRMRIVGFLTVFILLAAIVTPVFAQEYSFNLRSVDVVLTVNEDGSIALDYTWVFQNDPGAHEIDYVDVGLPNENFDLSTVTGTINGQPVTSIDSMTNGVSLYLGSNAIQPGESGTVTMRVESIPGVLYTANSEESEPYASFQFSPTWFGSEYVNGSTNASVTLVLPAGLTPEEPRYFQAKDWPGTPDPVSGYTADGRVYYRWQSQNATGSDQYTFGAAFPARLVPAAAITTPPIVDFNFEDIIPCLCPLAIFGMFVAITIIGIRNAQKRKLQYLPPKISIEGHGIKRGLTAVEAAILMEEPMDKILMMVLFSSIKKEAAEVIEKEPLKLKVKDPLPDGLYPYEIEFLKAMAKTGLNDQKEGLQDMMINLVKVVSEKMKGFSRKETIAFYKDIINKAWAMVDAADTPEVKSQKFDEVMDWTMADRNYENRTQDVFRNQPVFLPRWWGGYDPSFGSTVARGGGGGGSVPTLSQGKSSGTISLPSLPGATFAASVTNGAQNMASSVVGNVNSFTSGVTNKTNPVPVSTSSGSGGGGGHSCACACACAGCACACAGGGR